MLVKFQHFGHKFLIKNQIPVKKSISSKSKFFAKNLISDKNRHFDQKSPDTLTIANGPLGHRFITLFKVAENISNELPLTEASLKLRRNVAFCSAVTTVQLLAASRFVKDVFRDGSHDAPYFLLRDIDEIGGEIREDAVPKTPFFI